MRKTSQHVSCWVFRQLLCSHDAFRYLLSPTTQPSTLPRHKMLCRTLLGSLLSSVPVPACSRNKCCTSYTYSLTTHSNLRWALSSLHFTWGDRDPGEVAHLLHATSTWESLNSMPGSPAPNQASHCHGRSRNIPHPNSSAIFSGLTELISHGHQWSNTLSKNRCLKIHMWLPNYRCYYSSSLQLCEGGSTVIPILHILFYVISSFFSF